MDEIIVFDVGSHCAISDDFYSFKNIKNYQNIIVYAFEPNVCVLNNIFGKLPNFIVIPMAVAEKNGFMTYHININDSTNSLLQFYDKNVDNWKSDKEKVTILKTIVPTIRLDTFMNENNIKSVEYLKIDAQGYDYYVVKSTGDRIRDIKKIQLEVQLKPLYSGSKDKKAVMDFLNSKGFKLLYATKQSYDQEENLYFERID